MASPAEVTANCDILITSLPSVRALEDVIGGDGGLLTAGRRELVVIETSTLPLDAKEAAHESLRSISSVLLDCPVSGTAAQARVGDLVVFASGDRATVEKVAWVFEAVGRSWHYVGEFGVGSKMKFIANLLIAVHNLAAAEALLLAKSAGLDPNLVHEVISDSAATSRMFEVSGRIMVDGEYADGEAKVEILHKDLQIIRSFASDARSPAPLLAVTTEFYTAAMALGLRSAGGCLGLRGTRAIGGPGRSRQLTLAFADRSGGHLTGVGSGQSSTRATARVGPPWAPITLRGNPMKVNRLPTTSVRTRFS